MGKVLAVTVAVLLFFGIFRAATNQPSAPAGPTISTEIAARVERLRNEALENIGWVAGNAYGRPIWPRIKEYVDEGGSYYNAFIGIIPNGGAADVMSNIQRYKAAVNRGRGARYDEADMMRRVARTRQISEEIATELGSVRR